MDLIKIRKASEHNLKSIDVDIPKNKLVVITGPSGSGKSTLAFDTLYVEGQRRYIESLSSYARQFLGQFQPPKVESISGLSPAIAIDQKTTSKNPRSTVGTVTEIYDYFRILFARVGKIICPVTGKELKKYSAHDICKDLLELPKGSKLTILSPVVDKYLENIDLFRRRFLPLGFSRVRLNGEIIALDEEIQFKKNSSLEIVIDRVVVDSDKRKRLIDSIEQALSLNKSEVIVISSLSEVETIHVFPTTIILPDDAKDFPALEPQLFSFNSPVGACPECKGIGETKVIDLDKIISDPNLSINEGGIRPLKTGSYFYKMVDLVAKTEGFSLDTPIKKYSKKIWALLFYGTDTRYHFKFTSQNSRFEFIKEFEGIISWLQRKYDNSASDSVRKALEVYFSISTCPSCSGKRLNRYSLAVKIRDQDIFDLCNLDIESLITWMTKSSWTKNEKIIAEKLLLEINSRLSFLKEVGLSYLTLNRASATISGGEAQRIRLATQIGSALSGVIYVLDEPSIGLHQSDNKKLIKTLKTLRDLNNSVIVVEHDEEMINEADYLIDLGPGAGIHGGEIMATCTPDNLNQFPNSPTAKFLIGSEKIEVPKTRRTPTSFLKIIDANCFNIKNQTFEIPLGVFVTISGVSGSGKSTLLHKILSPAIREKLVRSSMNTFKPKFKAITGLEKIDSMIELDQSPIGRTPHSNPATYSGCFDEIRKLFALTNEAKVRGYKQGRFSFNIAGGRCEDCEGNGSKKIEMHFLADVYITCQSCHGSRYNEDTLSVFFKGKNISDILNMTVDEALIFFNNHPKLARILNTMQKVGLGYLALGQSATTLSGGEAQRLKLSKELAKRTRGHCLYILDEPTTGLHISDVKLLISALNELVNQGNTVVAIEHNLDIIKSSDYILELGPTGGDKGGKLVAFGVPELLAKSSAPTAPFLKHALSSANKR